MKNKLNEIVIVKGGSRGEIESIELFESNLEFEKYCKEYGEVIVKLTFDNFIKDGYSVEKVESIVEEFLIGSGDVEVSKSGMIYCRVGVREEDSDYIILGSSICREDKEDLLNKDKDYSWDEIFSRLVE